MTTPADSKLVPPSYLKSFRRLYDFNLCMHDLWFGYQKIEHRLCQENINNSLRILEAEVTEAISEAVQRALAHSASPETFIVINNELVDFYLDCENMMLMHSSDATGVSRDAIFSDFQLAEGRRRMERQIDIRRVLFTEADQSQAKAAFVERDKGGRSPESNWEEIEAFVVSQFPNGFPKVRRTKTQIKEFIELWLEKESRTPPSERHLKRKATEIYDKYQ
jgi:hypothetical protein